MSTRTTPDIARPPRQPHPSYQPPPGTASDGPKLELSLSQVVGGSLAAATAAALGSRLGLVGTVTGAALVSVIASVAASLYTAWLERTQVRLSAALVIDRTGRTGRRAPRTLSARRVLVGALAVFALAAVAVTGLELMTGRSLDGTSGTTVAGTLRASDPDQGGTGSVGSPDRTPTSVAPEEPTPTPSASSTPTPSASTPPAPADPVTSAAPTGPVAEPTSDAVEQPDGGATTVAPTTGVPAPTPGTSLGPTLQP